MTESSLFFLLTFFLEMETSESVTKAMSDDCGWVKHLDEAFRKTIMESLQTIIESKGFHLLFK